MPSTANNAKTLHLSCVEEIAVNKPPVEVLETSSFQGNNINDYFNRISFIKTMKKSSSLTLREFLKKKSRILSFRTFLQKEFSEENLDFWLEVEMFKKNKSKRRNDLAQVIFDKYLAVDSLREINIDFSTRQVTKTNLLRSDISTFDVAQEQIFTLMERDSFRRFLLQLQNKQEKRKSSSPIAFVKAIGRKIAPIDTSSLESKSLRSKCSTLPPSKKLALQQQQQQQHKPHCEQRRVRMFTM